jgi:hypothetical protein
VKRRKRVAVQLGNTVKKKKNEGEERKEEASRTCGHASYILQLLSSRSGMDMVGISTSARVSLQIRSSRPGLYKDYGDGQA